MKQRLCIAFMAGASLINIAGCDSDSQAQESVQHAQNQAQVASEPEQATPHRRNHAMPNGDTIVTPEEAEARAEVADNMWVLVDIDLLGPNGELTVGFIKSLSPAQCRALDTRGLDMKSTDPEDVQIAFTHILVHRADAEKIMKICDDAQALWQQTYRPDSAPVPNP